MNPLYIEYIAIFLTLSARIFLAYEFLLIGWIIDLVGNLFWIKWATKMNHKGFRYMIFIFILIDINGIYFQL